MISVHQFDFQWVIFEKYLQASEGLHNVHLSKFSSLGDLSYLDPLVDLVIGERISSVANAKSGVSALALLTDSLISRLSHGESDGFFNFIFLIGVFLLFLDLVFEVKILISVITVDTFHFTFVIFLLAAFDEWDQHFGKLSHLAELSVKRLQASVCL
jgi:hypothetical protein